MQLCHYTLKTVYQICISSVSALVFPDKRHLNCGGCIQFLLNISVYLLGFSYVHLHGFHCTNCIEFSSCSVSISPMSVKHFVLYDQGIYGCAGDVVNQVLQTLHRKQIL